MLLRTLSLAILLAAIPRAIPVQAQTPSWTGAWAIGAVGSEHPDGAGIDANGNIYATASKFTVDDAGHILTNTRFLVSTSPDGTVRWNLTFLASKMYTYGGMAVDGAGNVYVTASFIDTMAIIDRGGSMDTIRTASNYNLLIVKYTAAGNLAWRQIISTPDTITASGLTITPDGIWIAGTFRGGVDIGETHLTSAGATDIFIAMLDSEGAIQRAIRAGGSSSEKCYGLATGLNGEVVMAGIFRETASFGDQTFTAPSGRLGLFLARYRADGSTAWARGDAGILPGSSPYGLAALMRVDHDGNIYLGVTFREQIGIGGTDYTATHEADGLIVKFRPDGTAAWGTQLSGRYMQDVNDLAIDTDGSVYVTGYSQPLPDGTAFLAKLSPTGARQWQITDVAVGFPGNTSAGPVLIDASHTVIVVGSFSETTRFGPSTITSVGAGDNGGEDLYVATVSGTSGVESEGGDDAVRLNISRLDRMLLW